MGLDVVLRAELADYAPVRAVWRYVLTGRHLENLKGLDKRFKPQGTKTPISAVYTRKLPRKKLSTLKASLLKLPG